MTRNELKIIADAKVATLPASEMEAYVATVDQYLFADDLCSSCDVHNSAENVDVFEIALDDRATAQFDY